MGDSPKFISIRFMAGGIFTLAVLFIGIFFEPMKLWMPSHLDPGKHRLSVTVFFDDRRPIYQIFEVEWSGNWQEDEELMKNELQIKKID